MARGSWLVVRKIPPLDKNGLWLNLTAGRPPLLSVLAAALHLPIVGTWRTRKALGVPYDGPGWGDFYEPRVTRGDVVILRLSPRSGI